MGERDVIMNPLILLFLLFAFPQEEGLPELMDGRRISANGKPIEIKAGHLVPSVADWNGDARKDLILGQFTKGRIRLYPNRGTDKNPVFKDFEFLRASGKVISLPVG